jgi:hypothetical protein
VLCTPSAVAVAALDASPTSPSPRRRRLWQLPTQAHELLLAMSFAPDVLRSQAARTLGQMHRGICILRGSDVDVLYSVVHDLASRNPLSEAFQKRLDEIHAITLRRLAVLRDADAVQAAWDAALRSDDMPAALWALLTHPLGPALEQRALYDARAWAFAHSRRSITLSRAGQQADARLQQAKQQVADLHARLLAQQQEADQAMSQARAEIARLSGEAARLQGLGCDKAPLTASPASTLDVNASPRPKARVVPTTQAVTTVPPPSSSQRSIQITSRSDATQPINVRNRRVLCVGGIRHAVSRYRERIEQLGGHFEHHDGGLEDGMQTLEGRLSRADLVICQAACINHEAYHRIKRHCERTGKPCVYLDRPSLSRFDRALVSCITNDSHLNGS